MRLSSAADPLPTSFRYPKMHPISAVHWLGKIGLKGLIANSFLTLTGQFLAAKKQFSAAGRGIATAS